jgi:hypothetical protein
VLRTPSPTKTPSAAEIAPPPPRTLHAASAKAMPTMPNQRHVGTRKRFILLVPLLNAGVSPVALFGATASKLYLPVRV